MRTYRATVWPPDVRDTVVWMRRCVAYLALVGCSSPAKPAPDAPSAFGVASAQVSSTLALAITFTDPPNPTEAAIVANYSFEPALVLAGNSMVSGATVTLGTMPQQAVTYSLAVAGITRLADGAPLAAATTTFVGHSPFDAASAMSTGVTSVVLAFDAAPDPVEATTLANYAITDPNALALAGTPVLAGNAVTLTTSVQSAVPYDVDVRNVTRASDHEPLYVTAASFVGADHCTDGAADGDETDVDCGGPTCTARCAAGKACSTGGDCASGTCTTFICS